MTNIAVKPDKFHLLSSREFENGKADCLVYTFQPQNNYKAAITKLDVIIKAKDTREK